jgi:hypothetical protein
MAKRTKQEPQAPEPGPMSPELLDLWARVLVDPRKYRLVDIETQTAWAFTVKDGKLVPVREVPCAQPVMLPLRAESEDGIIGDGAIPIWPNDPRYAERKAELDRLEAILKPGRAARRTR